MGKEGGAGEELTTEEQLILGLVLVAITPIVRTFGTTKTLAALCSNVGMGLAAGIEAGTYTAEQVESILAGMRKLAFTSAKEYRAPANPLAS